jgi:hypothetical protein
MLVIELLLALLFDHQMLLIERQDALNKALLEHQGLTPIKALLRLY